MKDMLTSELGEERIFVSGNKYNFIEWATYKNRTFKIGEKVNWFDPDNNNKLFTGKIKWMILIDNGDVQVDFNDSLGRISIKDLE